MSNQDQNSLSNLTIIHKNEKILETIKQFESYIKMELNVKKTSYNTKEEQFIDLYARPNLPVLGKRLGKRMGKFTKLITNLTLKEVSNFEEKGMLNLEGESFNHDDILLFKKAKKGVQAISNRYITIDLDTTLTQDLLREGLAREVVNRIQKTRKEINLNIEDHIHIRYDASKKLLESLKHHGEYIKRETLAETLSQETTSKHNHSFDIEGEFFHLSIEKVFTAGPNT